MEIIRMVNKMIGELAWKLFSSRGDELCYSDGIQNESCFTKNSNTRKMII